jgi:two-component system, OmpR family, sensor kinase
VRLLRDGFSLSIFARTFLLMIAALVVAELIGLALLINRLPLQVTPLRLSLVARQLRGAEPPPLPPGAGSRDQFGSGPPGPPQDSPGGPPQNSPGGPPRAPPPGDGPPPDNGPRFEFGEDAWGHSDQWILRDAAVAPTGPADTDPAASAALRRMLASRLRVPLDRVRLFVTAGARRGPDPDPTLPEGFVAGYQQSDGRWRVMESVVNSFPTRLQQQAMWLFVLGLLVLLPLSWMFSRALSAPIRNFSAAARRLGNDPGAPPLRREGPAEMQSAVDSFNAMQARLNRLLQERTNMIGAIAHDLRTPLTRLAFRLDDLPAPLNQKVTADIDEMRSMISAALDFIRDRSLAAQRERLDFRLLVESVVDDQVDIGRDVTLQSGDAITLTGDPIALRRMVVNLVDNALKYGQRARLRLRTMRGECILEIDDDGPGIPEPLLQQVFEPFYRAEHSRNRDTGGIGLGLATVRAVALDHGGSVTLRNRPESGLRATVSLPVTD